MPASVYIREALLLGPQETRPGVVVAFFSKRQKMKNRLSVSRRQERQITVYSYQDMLLVGENACTTEEGVNANKSQKQKMMNKEMQVTEDHMVRFR